MICFGDYVCFRVTEENGFISHIADIFFIIVIIIIFVFGIIYFLFSIFWPNRREILHMEKVRITNRRWVQQRVMIIDEQQQQQHQEQNSSLLQINNNNNFPSGIWKGYYNDQSGRFYEIYMFKLYDIIIDNEIRLYGCGSDDGIGRYSINGIFNSETGRLYLSKQYNQRTLGHTIECKGTLQKNPVVEAGIYGSWSTIAWSNSHGRYNNYTGQFHIWPCKLLLLSHNSNTYDSCCNNYYNNFDDDEITENSPQNSPHYRSREIFRRDQIAFPSGKWMGYYQRYGVDRRFFELDMNGSVVKDEVVLLGDGTDEVGSYRIDGTFNSETGLLAFTKQYICKKRDIRLDFMERNKRDEYLVDTIKHKAIIQNPLLEAGIRGLFCASMSKNPYKYQYKYEGAFRIWPCILPSSGLDACRRDDQVTEATPLVTGTLSSLNNTYLLDSSNVISASENECVVCFDQTVSTALRPCGHIALCTPCAIKLDKCPICRTSIDSVEQLYFSHANTLSPVDAVV